MNTIVDGVIVSPLRVISDERGSVLHMLRSDAPDFTNFGECYFSEILPGMVKGWKKHHLQTQYFSVPVGNIRLVIFDDRSASPSQGNIQIIQMGRPDNYVRVRVPPLVWYSFGCTSNIPALLANCADMPHDPAESEQRPLDSLHNTYCWHHHL